MFWKYATPWLIAFGALIALCLTIWITNSVATANFRAENAATYQRAYAAGTSASEARMAAAIATHNLQVERLVTDLNTRSAASDASLRASQARLTQSTQALLTHLQDAYPDSSSVPPSTQELLHNSAQRWPSRLGAH